MSPLQSELDLLLRTAIDSLAKLELLLYLHARPATAERPSEIGARLRRPAAEVESALKELAEAGLIERFALGTGRLAIYGPTEDAHVQELLSLLHEQYHGDPQARARIVRAASSRTHI